MQYTELKTTNKKTLDFYNTNPIFNFELMNDIFVDILEELAKSMSGSITTNMSSKFTKTLSDQTKELSQIKDQIKTLLIDNNTKTQTMKELNNDMLNNIIIKLFDIKKDNMNDIKQLIDKHETDNMSKIVERFDRETQKIIKEIIPTSNTQYYSQYETLIKSFYNDIKQTTNTNNVEDKYNKLFDNIEKNLINYITTTELRLNQNITEIKNIANNNYAIQDKMNGELTVFLDKYKNSSFKGALAENRIEDIINTLYPHAEINRTAQENKSGDIIMNRTDKTPILFEIKDYNRNIPTEEINKFIRDINEHKISGVFISISTGISKKHNFQIDINETNNIMVYIHNMNYDESKLKCAVDIIDTLQSQLLQFNKNDITISRKTIEQLNKDYQSFINKRTQTLNHIKESTKKTIMLVEEMELKSLNEYLSSKFSLDQTNSLKCNICNKFIGTNKKSLATHKRKCKTTIAKPATIDSTDYESSESS
jgi:hypothetical protein